jgi:hypothetical protein
LAAILYLIVVLPVYATAQCSYIKGDLSEDHCIKSNLTDYQRLTLANIPMLEPAETDSFQDILYSFFLPVHGGDLARLYAVVFCAWIVTWYALQQLQVEWGEVLAMRRVYYLEADHWSDRNEELHETLLRDEWEKTHSSTRSNNINNNTNNKDNKTAEEEADESYMKFREPWIPHPEQRDTVPNVELYSILVGGLPSLPTEVVDAQDVEAVFSRKQSIDWQLAVTTAFFDHCVPNQPGFSSSVAAVTILPAASHLTEAWNQWYKAAGKLRRLRFIRRQIAERRRYDIDNEDAYPEDDKNGDGDGDGDDPEQPPISVQTPPPKLVVLKRSNSQSHRQSTVYTDSEQKKMYHQEVLGHNTDLEVENNLLHALDFGPEQTAVYSREFALGAANLAPNGWHEYRIKRAKIDDLLLMEKVAANDVHAANLDLRRAQERIAESSSNGEDDLSDDDFEQIMRSASTHGRTPLKRVNSNDDTEDTRINRNGFKSPSSHGKLMSTAHSNEKSFITLSSYDSDADSFAAISEEFSLPINDVVGVEEKIATPKSTRIVGRSESFAAVESQTPEATGGDKRRGLLSAGKLMSSRVVNSLNTLPVVSSMMNSTPHVVSARACPSQHCVSSITRRFGVGSGLVDGTEKPFLGYLSTHATRSEEHTSKKPKQWSWRPWFQFYAQPTTNEKTAAAQELG